MVAAKGFFITFEGTEGAGKTTQIRRLEARLTAEGRRVRVLREPGGTPIGEYLRALLQDLPEGEGMSSECELLLFAASRAQLTREVILPALAAGEVVLCDRFLDSTVAYQAFGRGLPLHAVEAVNALAVGVAVPDVTFLLTVSEEVQKERMAHRSLDRIERSGDAFFLRVRQGYETLLERAPERVVVLSAEGSESQVEEAIWEELKRREHVFS